MASSSPNSRPATQADLWKVRTDLQEELRTTKTVLKADFHRLAIGLVKTNERIDALERSLNDKIDQNTNRILGAIDAFAAKAEAYDRKALSHGAILQDHEAKLRGHDRRLSRLEGSA